MNGLRTQSSGDIHVDHGVSLSRINVSIRPIKCLDGNIINWRPQTQVRHRVSGDPGLVSGHL